MMSDKDIAKHELAHVIAGALSLKRWHPHLYKQAVAEIEINVSGGHACLMPEKMDGAAIPQSVLRHMALGPLCAGGIEQLREVLRSKLIPRDGNYLSQADWLMVATKGGDVLSIEDCELMSAAARVCHGEHFDTAASAIVDCKSIVMSLSHFLSEDAAGRAWRTAGKDFMALHDRYRHELPEWCSDSVNRRYAAAVL